MPSRRSPHNVSRRNAMVRAYCNNKYFKKKSQRGASLICARDKRKRDGASLQNCSQVTVFQKKKIIVGTIKLANEDTVLFELSWCCFFPIAIHMHDPIKMKRFSNLSL